jgi:alanine racemase
MLESYSRAWAEVDYDAIAHNLDEVQKLIGKTKIMGIVKANAYGHGDVACAKKMEAWGVDFFGVSSIDEAIVLREGGITSDILILGYTPQEHFEKLLIYNLVQSLVSLDYAKKLDAFAKEKGARIRAHAKLDTGMNRTGVLYQDDNKHFEELKEEYLLENVRVEGIFSHFPVSDSLAHADKAFTTHQIELFNEAVARLKEEGIKPGLRHIQNSYGILNYFDLGYEYCRPGLLYMGVTSDDQVEIASNPDFIPILSLKANISYVRTLPKGATISYGRTHTLEKSSKIATMSIGYADGLSRSLSNQNLEVIVRHQKAPIIGRICMDQCMIDVTDIEDVQEGDEVILIGRDHNLEVTVDEISRKSGTINNETLCAIASRVPRLKKKDALWQE